MATTTINRRKKLHTHNITIEPYRMNRSMKLLNQSIIHNPIQACNSIHLVNKCKYNVFRLVIFKNCKQLYDDCTIQCVCLLFFSSLVWIRLESILKWCDRRVLFLVFRISNRKHSRTATQTSSFNSFSLDIQLELNVTHDSYQIK